MNRKDENNKALEVCARTYDQGEQQAVLLADISKSLAVIADALNDHFQKTVPDIMETYEKNASKEADDAYRKIMTGDYTGGAIVPDNLTGWKYKDGGNEK